jgi:carbon-monoxide dehydrogenase small subunit
MSDARRITITVNGIAHERQVEPRRLLSDFLREDLELTGTHVGCEHGVCGVCTILVDGRAARACLMFAVQADGARVDTIEGLSANAEVQRLQALFAEHRALQCGFCTAGILMSLEAFVRDRPEASDEEIREALAGNLCRCTGYEGIVAAVRDAAARARMIHDLLLGEVFKTHLHGADMEEKKRGDLVWKTILRMLR